MREHPIPQDVTGYKFHIVGNMTIKQFGEIFAGAIIAIIIYNLNLHEFIKYPLMLFFFGLGAAIAFVPIEERPLDTWLTIFIKAMYKPTKFFWRKVPKIPAPFLYKQTAAETKEYNEVDLTPTRRKRIQEYLSTSREESTDGWEISERKRVSEILGTFGMVEVLQTNVSIHKSTKKPSLSSQPRSMRALGSNQENVVFSQENQAEFLDPSALSPQEWQQQLRAQKSSAENTNEQIAIPDIPVVKIGRDNDHKQYNRPELNSIAQSDMAFSQINQQTEPVTQPTQKVITNTNLPFPSKPTEKNKVVGMVLTPENNLIANAIVEIHNTSGQIVRAVKTNALGQFFVATPLNSGSYIINADKDGYTFTDQKLELAGEIVEPIEIRSQNS